MSVAKKRAALVAFLVFGGHAQAQFKGMADPMPAMPAPPMAMPTPITVPGPGPSAAPITPSPSVAPEVDAPAAAPADAAPETTAAVPSTAPTEMVPGCPDKPDCPQEPDAESPLGEAVKEMLKEFAKCEAEGRSLEQCLSDDPPPPHLSQLTEEDRTQLTQCLGSSDLSVTKERWSGCLVGAD